MFENHRKMLNLEMARIKEITLLSLQWLFSLLL
jgi:hypothetical protein